MASTRLLDPAFDQETAFIEDRMCDGGDMGVDALQIAQHVEMH